MSWDRPFHYFTNLSYTNPKNWGLSMRLEYESGRRYTRSIIDTLITVNDQQYYEGPREDDKPYYYLSDVATKNIDLKFYKTLELKHFGIKLYLEAENLLDERTPRRINPYTGRGYDPGEIIGYHLANSPDPNLDPSRFRKPRSIEIGFQVIF